MAKSPRHQKLAKFVQLGLSGIEPDGAHNDAALNMKAYLILRESLLSGAFEPGLLLNIRPLADELNMSPMPVREALSRLRADGGLETLANRAFRVPVTSVDTYRQIMIMRLRLEACLCERAAVIATSEDIIRITELYDKMEEAAGLRLEDYLYAHRKFHFGIYETAQMPAILSVVEGLWLRIGPVLRASSLGSRITADRKHHLAMLHAMRTYDPEALVRYLGDDVTDGVELVQEYLRAHQTEAPDS